MATATAARPGAKANGAKGVQVATRPAAAPKPAATTAQDEDLIFDLSETPDYGGAAPERDGMFKVRVISSEKGTSKAGNPTLKITLTVLGPTDEGATILKTQALTERSMGFVKTLARSFGAEDKHMKRLNLAQFVKPGAIGYVKFTLGKMQTITDEESGEEIERRGFYDVNFVTKARYEASVNAAATAEQEGEAPAEKEAPSETTDDDI